MKFCFVIFLGFMLTNNLLAMQDAQASAVECVVVHKTIDAILDRVVVWVECLRAEPDFDGTGKALEGVRKVFPLLPDYYTCLLLKTLSNNARTQLGATWYIREYSTGIMSGGERFNCKGAQLGAGIELIVDGNFKPDDLNKAKEYFQGVIGLLCADWKVKAVESLKSRASMKLLAKHSKPSNDYYCFAKVHENKNDSIIIALMRMLNFSKSEEEIFGVIEFEPESRRYYLCLVVRKDFWQTFNAVFGLRINH